ncbi:hypothetical protein TWF481_011687 [Arthrobotrys musiformis]|uniref:Fungal N-terminal domain-containing protein n=1 Tax=Arthrobotrys musiformis TaxID=47236 RepID=A0AAV9W1Y8_9PEZI
MAVDPLSITAGAFSILASLTTLSMKISEFCQDFSGAKLEIQGLTEEVNTIGLVVKQLNGNCNFVNKELIGDLSKVLQGLNTVIIQTQLFLSESLGRKMRGTFWAFSGKKRCADLCRRLEAHKSTLSVTLMLVSITSVQGLHNGDDKILAGIHNIRERLPKKDDTGEGYILQRYLTELESVYDTSTAAGDWDDGQSWTTCTLSEAGNETSQTLTSDCRLPASPSETVTCPVT